MRPCTKKTGKSLRSLQNLSQKGLDCAKKGIYVTFFANKITLPGRYTACFWRNVAKTSVIVWLLLDNVLRLELTSAAVQTDLQC
ncbi:hypothetical protein SAMN05216214_10671 [Atopomonas hussainii]|uniref:Uncharacterized protein n=2 Tax=Atopomonas hussainii TaxID=1429083 RepID=A0A1H7KVI0_9GAMM|nr:hypothetical protein SAMN05216214_10671 [Atopomonas hussainii]